eukprot:556783-Prymnesium_polylepis.2
MVVHGIGDELPGPLLRTNALADTWALGLLQDVLGQLVPPAVRVGCRTPGVERAKEHTAVDLAASLKSWRLRLSVAAARACNGGRTSSMAACSVSMSFSRCRASKRSTFMSCLQSNDAVLLRVVRSVFLPMPVSSPRRVSEMVIPRCAAVSVNEKTLILPAWRRASRSSRARDGHNEHELVVEPHPWLPLTLQAVPCAQRQKDVEAGMTGSPSIAVISSELIGFHLRSGGYPPRTKPTGGILNRD